MKKKLIIMGCILFCFGCSKDSDTINYIDAKEKIINDNAILIDVDTEDEYNKDHIEGSLSLPVDLITETNTPNVIDSQDKEVIVYCRKETTCTDAINNLKSLGYTNVYNFGLKSNWKN